MNWFNDYSAVLHFKNCNLTSESPQILKIEEEKRKEKKKILRDTKKI